MTMTDGTETMLSRLTRVTRERDAAREALDAYKVRVRDEALEIREKMNWCIPGLNEHLRNLDLDEYQPVTEHVGTIVLRVPITVDTSDYGDAMAWCRNAEFTVSVNDQYIKIRDEDGITLDADRTMLDPSTS